MCQICFKHQSRRNTDAAIYSLSHNIVLLVDPTCDQEFNIFRLYLHLPIHWIPQFCYKATESDTTSCQYWLWCYGWVEIKWHKNILYYWGKPFALFSLSWVAILISRSMNFSTSSFSFYLNMYNLRWCTPNWFN